MAWQCDATSSTAARLAFNECCSGPSMELWLCGAAVGRRAGGGMSRLRDERGDTHAPARLSRQPGRSGRRRRLAAWGARAAPFRAHCAHRRALFGRHRPDVVARASPNSCRGNGAAGDRRQQARCLGHRRFGEVRRTARMATRCSWPTRDLGRQPAAARHAALRPGARPVALSLLFRATFLIWSAWRAAFAAWPSCSMRHAASRAA